MIKHPTHEPAPQSRHSDSSKAHDSGHLSRAAAASSDAQRHQAIAARAYQKYLDSGRNDGHDVENWLKAEEELQAEQQHHQSRSGNSDQIQTAHRAELAHCVTLQ